MSKVQITNAATQHFFLRPKEPKERRWKIENILIGGRVVTTSGFRSPYWFSLRFWSAILDNMIFGISILENPYATFEILKISCLAADI
jgi:hypothetical protein